MQDAGDKDRQIKIALLNRLADLFEDDIKADPKETRQSYINNQLWRPVDILMGEIAAVEAHDAKIRQDAADKELIELCNSLPPYDPNDWDFEGSNEKYWFEYDDLPLGLQRQFIIDELRTQYGDSHTEEIEFYFQEMMEHANCKEDYAIAYGRIGKQRKTKHPISNIDAYWQRLKRHEGKSPFAEQVSAFKRYAKEHSITLFYTYLDIQTSLVEMEQSLPFLRMCINVCRRFNATLLVCDLGSVFKHPDYFALLQRAKNDGINVVSIGDNAAINAALRTTRTKKPKVFAATTHKKRNNALARNPIFDWKASTVISTKLFNHFEYLANGDDPIYRYFLSSQTSKETDPSEWEYIKMSDSKIATHLNEMGFLTKDGYAWNKQLVWKLRKNIIKTDLFKKYIAKKFEKAVDDDYRDDWDSDDEE